MSPNSSTRTVEGYLELVLTSDQVSYEAFPKWSKSFLKKYRGELLERIDGPDCRIHRVLLLGQKLELVYSDFPVETLLVAKTPAAELVLKAIADLELRQEKIQP